MADEQPLVDERDREYAEKQADPKLREAVLCTVTTYRRPDRLAPGDPTPALELARLDGAGTVALARLERPALLIFGSYT